MLVLFLLLNTEYFCLEYRTKLKANKLGIIFVNVVEKNSKKIVENINIILFLYNIENKIIHVIAIRKEKPSNTSISSEVKRSQSSPYFYKV